jgi:single-strand DNA-binding protein
MANTSTITGNLVRDPELRFTSSGQPVANFAVADNRRWQDRSTGEWNETTTYLDIVAWGPLGEHAAGSLHKGDRVTVTGRLDQRSWENGDGERRTKLELVASDVAASVRFATLAITKTGVAEAGEDGEES